MNLDFNEKDWETPCPKYDCRKTACKCGLKYVNIPASLGDDSEGSDVAPKNGAYCNALVVYEANNHVYIYSKEGVPTLIDVDASDISTLEQEVRKAQKDIHEFREDIDRFAYFFDTVADMKSSTVLKDGDYVRTGGFYNVNDGGAALYKMSILGSANGKDIIACQNGLLAHLTGNGEYYPEQLGAYGDNTHDDTNIIQYVLDNYGQISLYKKTYKAKGIKISSDNVIKGNNATLEGEGDTAGFLMYGNTNNENIRGVKISNINLKSYTIGILAINCQRCDFSNVSCRYCGVGANFAGGCWINRFYECEFSNNTSHGFECGKDFTHPITQSTITPNTATFDFISCFFAGNGGYGATGWMREFTFNGGHSEANALGAFNILTVNNDGVQRVARCNTFLGVDIEGVNKGYVIESTGQCYYEYLTVIGGQIDLSGEYDTYKGALVIKGTSCQWNRMSNIHIYTRIPQDSEGDRNIVYCDGSENSTIQADIRCTNRVVGYFNSHNLRYIIPNGIIRLQSDLPKRQIGGNYYDGNNIVIPNGQTLAIKIDNLCFIGSVVLTTSASVSSLICSISGTYISGYVGTGVLTASTELVEGENKATFAFGNKGDNILISNTSGSDVTITNVYVDGYRVQY